MTLYYDVIDWIGGWPFEVASPEEIFVFFRNKNFILLELVTCGGKHGHTNEKEDHSLRSGREYSGMF